jgi:hypothetical protein
MSINIGSAVHISLCLKSQLGGLGRFWSRCPGEYTPDFVKLSSHFTYTHTTTYAASSIRRGQEQISQITPQLNIFLPDENFTLNSPIIFDWDRKPAKLCIRKQAGATGVREPKTLHKIEGRRHKNPAAIFRQNIWQTPWTPLDAAFFR